MSGQPIALATVVTDDFLPGTQVMISSFLAHNPWFDGDIVIIHCALSEKSRAALSAIWPELVLHPVGDQLSEQMDAVSQATGWSGCKKMQFASLEALALQRYDSVIFCDSDLLFLGSIETLLHSNSGLVACGDGAYFRGSQRRVSDFAEIEAPDQAAATEATIGRTFNTGMMVLKSGICSPDNYQAVMEMMVPELWASDQTGHTDQWLLNVHFAGQQELAPSRFNYMLSHRELIEQSTGEKAEEAIVLHFTGPAKPWLPVEELAALGTDQVYFRAYAKWRAAYAECSDTN